MPAWPTSSEPIQELLSLVAAAHEREVSELRFENERLLRLKGGNGDHDAAQVLTAIPLERNYINEMAMHQGNGQFGSEPPGLALRGVVSPRGPDEIALEAAFDAAQEASIDEASCDFMCTDVVEDEVAKQPDGVSDGAPFLPSSTAAPKFAGVISLEDLEVSNVVPKKVQSKLAEEDSPAVEPDEIDGKRKTGFKDEVEDKWPAQQDETHRCEGWRKLIRYAQAKTGSSDLIVYQLGETWWKVEQENSKSDSKRAKILYGGKNANTVSTTLYSLGEGSGRPSNGLPGKNTSRPSMRMAGTRNVVYEQLAYYCPAVLRFLSTEFFIANRPRCAVMHPNSRKRVSWDLLGMLLLIHDLLMIPMTVFQQGTSGMPTEYEDFTTGLDVVSALFWSFDICVSFLTGYYSSEGFLIVQPSKVAKYYLRSWFLLDLIIVLSDWTTIVIGLGSTTGYLRLGKTVSRVLRVLRLLRFMKLNTFMKEALERINSEYVLTIAGLVKLVLIIVVLNHYIACMWWALSQAGAERNWADKFLNHTDSITMSYATALHWSLTQFTPASMEVYPQNEAERIFNTLVIIMAMVTFSSFVSSITSAMTHIRNINARKMEQDAKIRQYFFENKVSHEVASRIWHFLKRNHGASGKLIKEADIPILKTLPERIRDELRLEVYMPILGVHPVFHIYFSMDSKPLLLVCKQCLELRTLLAAQDIYPDKGKIQKMFFVMHGRAIYQYSEDLSEYLTVARSMWACEAALWSTRAQLEGPFVAAAGGCELVLLGAGEFQAVAKNHPESIGFLAVYARLFVESLNEASEDSYYDELLFDNIETVRDLAVQAFETCGFQEEKKGRLGQGALLEKMFDAAEREIRRTRCSTSAIPANPDKDAEHPSNSKSGC